VARSAPLERTGEVHAQYARLDWMEMEIGDRRSLTLEL
jgi:hypothetical protein